MKRFFLPHLFTIVLLLFANITITAQKADDTAKIDALFASYHNEMPGVAIAVSVDGKLLYNKAFGLANLEYMIPNTSQTIFECGSVSKQFVAAAIVLLAKEGKISLDDEVNKYIPELPKYDAPITINMMLSHTSGLKDWGALYSLTGWPRTTKVYTQKLGYDIIFKQKSLNFHPGSQYFYSNSNYMLLTLIVERVSGQSLAQFTTNKFFKPLGMNNSQWRDNHRTVLRNRATAYTQQGGHYLLNMPFENLHGPGGLLTTTADLLKWNSIHESLEIFGEEYAKNRVEERKLNDGTPSSYAAGFTISKYNDYEEIAHSGSTGGYRAWLAWYPQKKLSIVLLSNYALFSPAAYGRAIAAIYLGKEPATTVTPVNNREKRTGLSAEEAERYIGDYYSSEVDATYHITCIDGNLMLSRRVDESISLIHISNDRFTTNGNGDFQFLRDRRGRITGFTVSVSRAFDVPFIKTSK